MFSRLKVQGFQNSVWTVCEMYYTNKLLITFLFPSSSISFFCLFTSLFDDTFSLNHIKTGIALQSHHALIYFLFLVRFYLWFSPSLCPQCVHLAARNSWSRGWGRTGSSLYCWACSWLWSAGSWTTPLPSAKKVGMRHRHKKRDKVWKTNGWTDSECRQCFSFSPWKALNINNENTVIAFIIFNNIFLSCKSSYAEIFDLFTRCWALHLEIFFQNTAPIPKKHWWCLKGK